jgi:hypothetical protein
MSDNAPSRRAAPCVTAGCDPHVRTQRRGGHVSTVQCGREVKGLAGYAPQQSALVPRIGLKFRSCIAQ